MPTPSKILTRLEVGAVIAALWYGEGAEPISPRTIHNWRKFRGLPCACPAGRPVFYRDQVENWARRELQRSGNAFPGGLARQQSPTTPARAGTSPQIRA